MSDELDPHVVDGLTLMRAFMKISDAADRRRVIDLAATLAKPKTSTTFAAKLVHGLNAFTVVMLGVIGLQALSRRRRDDRDDD